LSNRSTNSRLAIDGGCSCGCAAAFVCARSGFQFDLLYQWNRGWALHAVALRPNATTAVSGAPMNIRFIRCSDTLTADVGWRDRRAERRSRPVLRPQ
jgi:thioredoxin reductase